MTRPIGEIKLIDMEIIKTVMVAGFKVEICTAQAGAMYDDARQILQAKPPEAPTGEQPETAIQQ